MQKKKKQSANPSKDTSHQEETNKNLDETNKEPGKINKKPAKFSGYLTTDEQDLGPPSDPIRHNGMHFLPIPTKSYNGRESNDIQDYNLYQHPPPSPRYVVF